MQLKNRLKPKAGQDNDAKGLSIKSRQDQEESFGGEAKNQDYAEERPQKKGSSDRGLDYGKFSDEKEDSFRGKDK